MEKKVDNFGGPGSGRHAANGGKSYKTKEDERMTSAHKGRSFRLKNGENVKLKEFYHKTIPFPKSGPFAAQHLRVEHEDGTITSHHIGEFSDNVDKRFNPMPASGFKESQHSDSANKSDDFEAISTFDKSLSRLSPGKPVFVAREAQFIHRQGITLKDLEEMKANFDNNTVGLAINFDYDHKNGEAAGWVDKLEWGQVEVEEENDGKKETVVRKALFAIPRWTPPGAKAVDDCTYLYTSPSIFRRFQHPETGETYKNVLRRIALTNDPQMLSQPPVELSALPTNGTKPVKGDTDSMEKIASFLKALGSASLDNFNAADASEEDVVVAMGSVVSEFKAQITTAEAKADEFKAKYEAESTITKALNKQVDEFKTKDSAAKVDALVAKAVGELKVEPAKADQFRAQAVKDYAGAEAMLALMQPNAEFKSKQNTEGSGDGDGEGKDEFSKKQAAIEAIAEKMAKESGKPKETHMRAAMQQYSEDLKAKGGK